MNIGRHSLGFRDRHKGVRTIYYLPRFEGEKRNEYISRFFREVQGLGQVFLYYGKRQIAIRKL